MISNINSKVHGLEKGLNFLSSKYKRNYKGMIHDEVRDSFIKNLESIKEGLEFVEKELRVVGGTIDIVAKNKNNEEFCFIEVKTGLSRYYTKSNKENAKQLLKQKEGLEHTVSIFTNKKVNIKLILVEYMRDTKKVVVTSFNDSGKIENTKEFILKDD